MTNIVKIRQLVAKILRFFNFSKWRRPSSWIFKFVKFYWQTVSGRSRHIKIGRFIVIILRFFEFLRWPRRDRGFLKSRNFIGYLSAEGWDASACQLSVALKSINRFEDIKIFRFLPHDPLLSAVYAVVVCLCVCVSVCLCVWVSVTLRYCIKTAKRRITQTTPHDSPMTLIFWRQRSWRNSNGITPYGGDECRWGGLKLVTFDEKRAITR